MAKFKFKSADYLCGNYLVDFREQYRQEKKEDDPLIVEVDIAYRQAADREWRKYGTYTMNLGKNITEAKYLKIERKFLEDPKYRKGFFTEGKEWTESFDLDAYLKYKIHPRLRIAISAMQCKPSEKVKDEELASLKVGGVDKFSRMSKRELYWFLSSNAEEVRQYKPKSRKQYLNALRWAARGVNPDLAMRKAKLRKKAR